MKPEKSDAFDIAKATILMGAHARHEEAANNTFLNGMIGSAARVNASLKLGRGPNEAQTRMFLATAELTTRMSELASAALESRAKPALENEVKAAPVKPVAGHAINAPRLGL